MRAFILCAVLGACMAADEQSRVNELTTKLREKDKIIAEKDRNLAEKERFIAHRIATEDLKLHKPLATLVDEILSAKGTPTPMLDTGMVASRLGDHSLPRLQIRSTAHSPGIPWEASSLPPQTRAADLGSFAPRVRESGEFLRSRAV